MNYLDIGLFSAIALIVLGLLPVLNILLHLVWCYIDEKKFYCEDAWLVEKLNKPYQDFQYHNKPFIGKFVDLLTEPGAIAGYLFMLLVGAFFTQIIWPVPVICGTFYLIARILRFLRRIQKSIRKLSAHSHDHPASVKKTKI